MKKITVFISLFLFSQIVSLFSQSYPIVDTGQEKYYNNFTEISAPHAGEAFYGQDANFTKNTPNYTDNGDGTITDNITGLIWSKSLDLTGDGIINTGDKLTYDEALEYAETMSLGGFTDWRVPSIKELYSLVNFSGLDPSGMDDAKPEDLTPFIDTDFFICGYGDFDAEERIIDAQMVSSNIYVGEAMHSDKVMFGYNFADGRIKGYPTEAMQGQTEGKLFYAYFVRGRTDYGINDFVDNGDGTVSDIATGLMWTQNDNGEGLNWQEALEYAQSTNSESYLGHSDWRLPNAKELQSIVDYTRSPQTTNSAAIAPVFNCSEITDEGGNKNFPFYWTSTTHANMHGGSNAVYLCFGEALGFMEEPPGSGNKNLMDVHGAGAQRSDPKIGNPADYPEGHGPQGDVIRIYNFVRLVRDIESSSIDSKPVDTGFNIFPNPASETINISISNPGLHPLVENMVIFNSLGQPVYQQTINNLSTQIDVSSFQEGVYLLQYVGMFHKFMVLR
jgi:hypothetical protein